MVVAVSKKKMVVDFTVGIVAMMNSVDRGLQKSSRTLAISCLLSSSQADLKKEYDKLVIFFSIHTNMNQLRTIAHLQLIALAQETI